MMIKKGILAGILVVSSMNLVLGGTAGKIAGYVTDLDTGDPLVGVNIIMLGTTLGAASDQNGYYVILNVPPGLYEVRASAIGYADYTVREVRVEIDLTTPLNYQMRTEALAGQAIDVVAESRIIKEDVAGSQTNISADRIINLPTASVNDVLGLEAGITSDLEIRGSQDDEALFMVDGVSLRDSRNNNPMTQIPLSAVNEISVQKGGFGAEYSNVRSGVVNVVTKEGDQTFYSGTITIKYSPAAQKHFGISPYDPNAFWLRPHMDPAVAWTGTGYGELYYAGDNYDNSLPYEDANNNGFWDRGERLLAFDDANGNGAWDEGEAFPDYNSDGEPTVWDVYTQRQYTSFAGWNEISKSTLSDDDQSNDLTPIGAQKIFRWQHRKQGDITAPDYNVDAGFGGPVPFVSNALGNLRFYASLRAVKDMYLIPLNRDALTDRSYLLKVTSDLTPSMKLTLMGFKGVTIATSRAYFASPGTAYFTTVGQIANTVDQIGHTLSWRLYMNEYWSRTDVFSDMWSAKLTHMLGPETYYELLIKRVGKQYKAGPGPARRDTSDFKYEIVDGFYVDEAPVGFTSTPVFALGDGMGMGGSVSTYRDSSQFTTTTLDINFASQVSPLHEISAGLSLSMDDFDTRYGTINKALPEGNTWVGISHDPDFASNPPFQKQPWRGTFYIEDKLEAKGFIALLGLTAEYINPNTGWYDMDSMSVFDANFFSQSYTPDTEGGFPTKSAKSQFLLSPRLGISHPITENSKLYFNYGHYRQLPFADALYRIQRGPGYRLDRIGDPSLPLERTVSYELGYDVALGGALLLHLAGYYKDIADQRSWTRYVNIKGNVNYYLLDNNSYEDIRGLEISLSKMSGRWLTGNLNYEYRVNTYGYFDYANQYGTVYVFENPSEGRKFIRDNPPEQTKPLPRPRFKANIAIHTPAAFGPRILGQNVLGGWLVNLLSWWTEGEWFTWNPNRIKGVASNVRWAPYRNIDLKASKTFVLGRLKTTFFLDVYNVFNFKLFSEAAFYDKYDHDYYMYSLHLPENIAGKLGTNYPNIPGSDEPGDVRKKGVSFAPIEWVATVERLPSKPASTLREVYYYVAESEQYMEYSDGVWQEASAKRIDEVLETKAYIDMPNQTYFTFLNPRDIFFGLRISLDLH
jgi:outer membrane receptor protein involved in Fe transport